MDKSCEEKITALIALANRLNRWIRNKDDGQSKVSKTFCMIDAAELDMFFLIAS